MGLTTWKNAPQGPIRKPDVTIAKNYLTAQEIREINRAGWVAKLDAFLAFNERDILTHAGNISLAQERAHAEFEKYEAQCCRIEATTPTSDFDRFVVKTR